MCANPIDRNLLELIEATSFPPAALRIYKLVSSDNTDIDQIVTAISIDPVLSAKVLKVANSPFFSRGRHTDNLKHALSLVGINAVRTVVLCAAIHDLYKAATELDVKMWAHTLGVSLIASMISKQTGRADENTAATAGLFHDIGGLVLKNAFPEKYAEMARSLEGSDLSFYSTEDRLFGTNHSIAGTLLAKKWGLGKDYSIVIAYHHQALPVSLTRQETDLVTIIKIADEIAFFFGIGFRKKTDLSNVPFDYLGMKKEKFDDLIWKVNDTYEEHIKSLTF